VMTMAYLKVQSKKSALTFWCSQYTCDIHPFLQHTRIRIEN
jgi:hypothetical protein